ncbi:MAG: hypothetical protein PHF56_19260 [Desulfuromonadaceae bacterium]|nr:hypothetical protein [Desulfuromonadaceae bacterium]
MERSVCAPPVVPIGPNATHFHAVGKQIMRGFISFSKGSDD